MRQVDAGAEQFFAAIFWMLDFAAAQHGDIGLGIEDGDIDRISMASSVVSSSALRKRSLFEVTMAALPRRSINTLPKSMRPSAAN